MVLEKARLAPKKAAAVWFKPSAEPNIQPKTVMTPT